MANTALQTFNVFLTERLTAAAVDIYGFVEKTITDYQEEVYQTKLENQRLQRLLDLVYKPEIRLHRADSRQIDLPTPTQEVCAQEQQKQKEYIPSEVIEEPVILPIKEELSELWTRSTVTPVCPAHSSVTDALSETDGKQEENTLPEVVRVGEHGEYEASGGLTAEHMDYQIPSQDDPPVPSFGVCPAYAKKNNNVFCNICGLPCLTKVGLKLHLTFHETDRPEPAHQAITCFICSRATHSRSQMICHMRTHTGEKPYACGVCGNRYKLKGHMKEHLRTHTGERPYACYICGKSFNRSSTMTKHVSIKHRENLPFKCAQCSQHFPLLVVFIQHLKTAHGVTFSV